MCYTLAFLAPSSPSLPFSSSFSRRGGVDLSEADTIGLASLSRAASSNGKAKIMELSPGQRGGGAHVTDGRGGGSTCNTDRGGGSTCNTGRGGGSTCNRGEGGHM